MHGIVWLASYPKSGNTWFRAFLANLLSGLDRPVPINALRTGSIASARPVFDDLAGVEASELSPDEIDLLRPDVYRLMAEEAEATEYHKVHDAYTLNSEGRPLLPPEATRAALYFVRNPLDVAVSYAHHSHCDVDTVIGWMAHPGHCFCAGPKRLHNQLRQRLLTWSGHVESWVDRPEFPVHVVRYEDMKLAPEATFTEAARFADLPTEPEAIARALEFSSFEELQRQEAETGFAEKNPRAESFFRKGVAGGWREALSEEQAAKVIEDHRGVMERFGYLDEGGEPVF